MRLPWERKDSPNPQAAKTRPVIASSDQNQTAQAELLRRTGNGPTDPLELKLLAAEFGPADENGVFGAPADEGSA
jgi:hypothetical protein